MKTPSQRLSIISTILIICLIFPSSCKKDKGSDPIDVLPQTTKALKMDKTTGTPGDVITVTTSFALEKDNYELSLGSKKVALMKVDDSTAVFMVPYIPAGKIDIDFSVTGSAEKKEITIAAYTPVNNPQPIVDAFKSNMADGIVESQQSAANMRYTESLKSFASNFNTEYDKLSVEGKRELAFMIDKLSALTAQTSGTFSEGKIFKTQQEKAGSEGEDVYRAGLKFVDLSAKTVLLLCGSALLIVAPDPLLTKVLGVATIALGTLYLLRTLKQVAILTTTIGNHYKIKFLSNLFNSPNQRSSSRSSVTSATVSENGVIDVFNFSKQKPATSFEVFSTYRGLSNGDKSQSGKFYSTVFSALRKLETANNQLKQQVDKLRGFFSYIPALPVFENPITDNAEEDTQVTPADKMSIENISDPSIKLTITASGNTVNLTTEGSAATSDKNFTFDLVYKNSLLEITNRKSLSATYVISVDAAKVEILTGDNQFAVAGKKLDLPLKVKVLDADNKVLEGIKVEWKVKSGGGSLSAAESLSDVNGIAQTEWTTGAGGTQEVEATVKKKDGSQVSGSPLVFKTSSVDLIHKWRVTSDVWKIYNAAGMYERSDVADPWNVEFLSGNVVRLFDARYSSEDTGNYILDSSGAFLTISDTHGDDYIFKYYISNVTADGMVLTTEKVYGYFDGPGYGVLQLILKR